MFKIDSRRYDPGATVKREALLPVNALINPLALAVVAGLCVAAWILFVENGWNYYTTSSAVRGYAGEHRTLRPSGTLGIALGATGTLFMVSTLFYVARKKMKLLSRAGSPKVWLEIHIFCGVFGPLLITFHTAFKFNGLISVAYWSMVLVVLSGFVGRYLFVRIPKTLKGTELSRAELEERVAELKERLASAALPVGFMARLDELERADPTIDGHRRPFLQSVADRFRARARMSALRRSIRRSGLDPRLLHESLDLLQERDVLLHRIAKLQRTRELFQLWHVFHRPLVWVMFAIFLVHLGVAIYFGYLPLGR